MAQGVGKDFNTVAGGLGQFASHLGSGIGGYLGEAAKGNPQYLVPLLTGLAAMTAAPTRNFGVALAQGLGTGAETYPALQTQQANLEAQNLTNSANARKIGLSGPSLVPDKNGPIQIGNNRYRAVNNVDPIAISMDGAPSASGVPAIPQTYSPGHLGAHGQAAAQNALKEYMVQTNQPNGPQLLAESEKLRQTALAEAASALNARPTLDTYADAVGRSATAKPGTGPYAEFLTNLRAKYNQVAPMLGLPQYQVGQVADNQIMSKMAIDLATVKATSANQSAFAALEQELKTAPNPSLTPEANSNLMATNQIGNQRSIDFQNYLQEFAAQHPNMSRQFLVQSALQAFNADAVDEKGNDRYAAEKANLIRMQVGKDDKGNYTQEWGRVRQGLAQAQGEDRQKLIAAIDKKYGPGFHRYLTGGRP